MNRLYFPSAEDSARIKRDTLISQAVEAYKAFYPAVSAYCMWQDNYIGNKMTPNRDILYLAQANPLKDALTPNSDTPYSIILFDLSDGPIVVDQPAGPIFGLFQTLYFELIGNTGLVGPDQGQGGKYVLTPPGFNGTLPAGYYELKSNTYKALGLIRTIQKKVDAAAALELTRQVKIYPLGQEHLTLGASLVVAPENDPIRVTSVYREDNLDYWACVHAVVQDVALPQYKLEYGRLARLGIQKGEGFHPDDYQKEILTTAAQIAIEHMSVESFGSHDDEFKVWSDRNWEWAGVIPASGYETKNYRDQFASDRWFFQATYATPLMFPRRAGTGSEYLLGLRDRNGQYLDGNKTYKLVVPPNVPAGLFWSLTVYDPRSRSEIVTDTNRAAARSIAEHFKVESDGSIILFFGPNINQDQEQNWVKTLPDRDWFCYFRTYGPMPGLYNGEWKLADFEEI